MVCIHEETAQEIVGIAWLPNTSAVCQFAVKKEFNCDSLASE